MLSSASVDSPALMLPTSRGEKNFHVFYYLYDGLASQGRLNEYALHPLNPNHRYLQMDALAHGNSVSENISSFNQIISAFYSLGFKSEVRHATYILTLSPSLSTCYTFIFIPPAFCLLSPFHWRRAIFDATAFLIAFISFSFFLSHSLLPFLTINQFSPLLSSPAALVPRISKAFAESSRPFYTWVTSNSKTPKHFTLPIVVTLNFLPLFPLSLAYWALMETA